GFYYRLGKNIHHCYMLQRPQAVPHLVDVGNDCFSWEMEGADDDWGYPNTVDFALYQKSTIQEAILAADFSCPNEFEGFWTASDRQKNRGPKRGICAAHSKIINLDLNAVSEYRERIDGEYSASHLNERFMKGKRIDIDQFYQIQNDSP